ncbi:rolling circle replication-associated protein [Diaphorobacter ruginosibacter]|uniref:rolling circle replication-associated protein n=1 Tax=Diaphorobacter ruginosibacter TaxID=1715720 RepID=UPI001FE3BBAF|nr:hypothetical protein [Diaphorobacter ruginosibacter]
MSALQAKNEARMQSMGALLFARQQARAAEQAARSAAGLVSVSTTCRTASGSSLIVGGETYTGKDQVALAWTDNVITIDPIQSRITRLRKSLGVASKALHNAGSLKQQMWMQTLTYRGDNRAWKPEHISRYLDALRKWHYAKTGSKTVRYAWVAELQDRGVIHYHIVVWLEGGLTPPKGDRPWSRKDRAGLKLWEPPMWPHGMTRRDKAYCPVAYLMKYVSKVGQKTIGGFPHGARIHGCGGLSETGRACRRWVLWPSYVQANASVQDRFRPAPGGGYVNAETGELLLSDFAPTGGGFHSFIRVRRGPRRIEPCGPFSWLPEIKDAQ